MASGATRESYADWLNRKMADAGETTRSLARKWKPKDPETARRAIRRYRNGMVPQARTRAELAEALGSDESGPSSDDADSEDDLVAGLRQRLREVTDLVERLAAQTEEQVA